MLCSGQVRRSGSLLKFKARIGHIRINSIQTFSNISPSILPNQFQWINLIMICYQYKIRSCCILTLSQSNSTKSRVLLLSLNFKMGAIDNFFQFQIEPILLIFVQYERDVSEAIQGFSILMACWIIWVFYGRLYGREREWKTESLLKLPCFLLGWEQQQLRGMRFWKQNWNQKINQKEKISEHWYFEQRGSEIINATLHYLWRVSYLVSRSFLPFLATSF